MLPVRDGEFMVVDGEVHEGICYVRGPDGAVQEWIRGFTFKEWKCAASGRTIVPNPYGEKRGSTEGWAWRVNSPLSGAWARIRVHDAVFRRGQFTLDRKHYEQ